MQRIIINVTDFIRSEVSQLPIFFVTSRRFFDLHTFGGRWEQSSYPLTDNRFRFSGKEDQSLFRLPYLDFGARMLNPNDGRFNTQDPLAHLDYKTSPYVYVRNNPIRMIDRDGRMAGDFWDEMGRYLGNDGIDDDKLYIMKTTESSFGEISGAGLSKGDARQAINFIKTNSGNTEAFMNNSIAYDNSIEIEGLAANRRAMLGIVSLDNGRGGTVDANNREYGGILKGGSVFPVAPGEVSSPEHGGAYIGMPSGYPTFHSHPSGTIRYPNGGESGYDQYPSTVDKNMAEGFTNYVFGKGNNTVYIYNSQGVQAILPMRRFVYPKR